MTLRVRFANLLMPLLDRADPSLTIARRRSLGVEPRIAVSLVYRRENAKVVSEFVKLHPNARLGFWALDDVDPELEGVTIGVGPGQRFALHNRIIEHLDLKPDEWLVVCDDDVKFEKGNLYDAIAIADTCALDLVQPTHGRTSNFSWPTTKRHLFHIARLTAWVEIGPVVILNDRARTATLPFPDQGMGWGVEFEWAVKHQQGIRLGQVDAVQINHMVPMGSSYDLERAQFEAQERIDRLGITPERSRMMMTADRRWLFCRSPRGIRSGAR